MTSTTIGPVYPGFEENFGGIYSVTDGPENVDLRFYLENDTTYERAEVFCLMVGLPQGRHGCTPTQLLNDGYHLQDVLTTTKYPTGWTVLAVWPDGKVRLAKAYINYTIPGKTNSLSVVREFLLIKDASVSASLPSYTQHSEVTNFLNNAVSEVKSQVHDIYWNLYEVNLLDSTKWDENSTVESNPWMRVYRRRSYHDDMWMNEKSLWRDLFSLTWYLYVPHNSRHLWLEVRLGNDYGGSDPTALATIYTGNGVATSFTGQSLAAAPGPYSVYVIAGSVEGRDNGRGQIIPMVYNRTVGGSFTSPTGTGTTSFTGTVPNTPIVPGTFSIIFDSNSSRYGRDDGAGNITGAGIASGTINYSSGAVAVTTYANIVDATNTRCTYGHTTGTAAISGTINYTNGALDLTFTSAPGGGVPIRANYIPNSRNNFPLGRMPFNSWAMRFSAGYADVWMEGYPGYRGNRFYDPLSTPNCNIYQIAGSPRASSAQETRTIGTGDGVATVFTNTLPHNDSLLVRAGRRILSPGSITITAGGVSVTDTPPGTPGVDDLGTFSGTGVSSGTVNYRTGAISITFSAPVGNTVPVSAAYLWDRSIPAMDGDALAYLQEHLQDGAGLARAFNLYAWGGSPTATENNTRTARYEQPMIGLPVPAATVTAQAHSLYEGGYRTICPNTTEPNRRAGWQNPLTIKEALDDYWNPSNWSNPWGYLGTTIPTKTYGSRGNVSHFEHIEYPGTAGTPRGCHHSHLPIIMHGYSMIGSTTRPSKPWKAVRHAYHSSMWTYVRGGGTLWNVYGSYMWYGATLNEQTGESPLGNELNVYVDQNPGAGQIPNPDQRRYSGFGSPQQLNRRYRKASGQLVLRFTNGQAGFSVISGNAGYWSGSGFESPEGTSGYKRLFVEGIREPFALTGPTTLASNWTGSTGDYNCVLTNEHREGVSQSLGKNDIRSYGWQKILLPESESQHIAWQPENSSHAGQSVNVDAWMLTGSWMVWDRIRIVGELFLAGFKHGGNGQGSRVFSGQARSNAWPFKLMLAARIATNYFDGLAGFEFINNLRGRFREAMKYQSYFLIQGQSPNGTLQYPGRPPLKDVPLFPEGTEWSRTGGGSFGSDSYGPFGRDLGYTGITSFSLTPYRDRSEFQNKFYGDSTKTFGNISVWEIGMLAPAIWGVAQELSRDPDPVISANWRRLAEGTTDYLIFYGMGEGTGPFPARNWGGAYPSRRTYYGSGYGAFATDQSQRNPAETFNFFNDDPATMPSLYYYHRAGDWVASQRQVPGACFDLDCIQTPVEGTGKFQSVTGTPDITTFEDGINFPGVHDGSLLQGQSVASDRNIRANTKLQTFSLLYLGPASFNRMIMPVLVYALKYHTNPASRDRAKYIAERWAREIYMNSGRFIEQRLANVPHYEVSDRWIGGFLGAYFDEQAGTFNAVGPGGDPTKWWPAQGPTGSVWGKRIRLSSNTTHSTYSTSDVLAVVLPSSVTSNSLPGLGDLRVVYQTDAEEFFNLPWAVRVKTVANQTILYFRPYAEIEAGVDIGASPVYAYYLYFSNQIPDNPLTWVNPDSLDGPFGSDADTVFLLNMDGSVTNEAGPRQVPFFQTAVQGPTSFDGPFGGSARFQAPLQSAMGALTANMTAPAGAFCLEFQIYVTDATLNSTTESPNLLNLFGLNYTDPGGVSVTPLVCYIYPTSIGGGNEIISSFLVGATQGNVTIPGTAWSRGAWQHIKFSYDGFSTITASVNGTVIATTTIPVAGALAWVPDVLTVGAFNYGGTFFYYASTYLAEARFSANARTGTRKVATAATITFGSLESLAVEKQLAIGCYATVATQATNRVVAISSDAYVQVNDVTLNLPGSARVAELANHPLPITSHSYVQVNDKTGSVPADAFVEDPDKLLNLPCNASVTHLRTQSIAGDAYVVNPGLTVTLPCDAVVAETQSVSLPADAYVENPGATHGISSHAYVQETGKFFANTTLVCSATVLSSGTAPVSLISRAYLENQGVQLPLPCDAVVAETRSALVNCRAALVNQGVTQTISSGATVVTQVSLPIGCDAWVENPGVTQSLPCNASVVSVLSDRTVILPADAFVIDRDKTVALPCDAVVSSTYTVILPCDGIVQTNDLTLPLPSRASVSNVGFSHILVCDAYVAEIRTLSIACDAVVAETRSTSLPCDAAVSTERTRSLRCRGFVLDENLILGAETPITISAKPRR